MARITLGKNQEQDFELLMALSEESLEILIDALEKSDIGLFPEKLAENLYADLGISKNDLVKILQLFFGINRLKQITGFSSEIIANDFIEAILETNNEKLKCDHCKEYILKVMSVGSISNTVNAADALANREKLLISTDIITDVRPIFKGNEFVSSMILYSLKVEYIEGDNTKNIYFALDHNDLMSLKENIQNAELRENAIQSRFNQADVKLITIEDE